MKIGTHDTVRVIESSWPSKHIVVVGDVMLDRYLRGRVTRVSPEAPVPVVLVSMTQEQPGGAANVAMNIAGLGAPVTLVGFTGDDEHHDALQRSLRAGKVNSRFIRLSGRPTTCKTRIIGAHQQMIRLDIEDVSDVDEGDCDALLQAATAAIQSADAVVLSDYGKGALPRRICKELISECRRREIPVLVDPKSRDFSQYHGATTICPNLRELSDALHIASEDVETILSAAQLLVRNLDLAYLTVTLSEKGIAVLREHSRYEVPARAREVFDVSGAGDTVIATLALASASDVPVEDAVGLANIAAGVVVGKLGTVPIRVHELIAELTSRAGTAVDEKRLSLDRLMLRIEEWRRAGEKIVFTNGCFDLLHPGHISLLQHCRTLGTKLVVALNSDDSVRQLKGASRPIVSQDDRALMLASLAATDAVYIFEELTPLHAIMAVRPDVLVKGGDYSREQVVGAREVESWGGEVRIVPLLKGYSTTELARRLTEPDSVPAPRTLGSM